VVIAPGRQVRGSDDEMMSLKRKNRPRSVYRRRARRHRQQRSREIWVRQWLTRRPLPLYGQYDQLPQELNSENPNAYRNFFRVTADMFGELLDSISPRIEKRDTNFR